MAFNAGDVVAHIKADTSDFQRGISSVSDKASGLTGVATKLGAVLAGAFAVAKIVDFGKEMLTQAGNFEQYLTGFEVLLGSMDRAKKLMADLTDFAKKTPFRLEEVVVGSKQLLAYGFSQEEVIENMKMLGNVSSALKVPMGDMVYLYGTLRSQGRAYTRDIIQFAQRGLPIWQMLADEMGMSVESVQEAVTDGQVTFETVSSAMNKLAGENGKWGDMMDKQSQTLMGKLSNLQDAWQQFTVVLGNIFLPVAKQVVDWLTNLIMFFQTLFTQTNSVTSAWSQLQTVVSMAIMYLQPMIAWFLATIIPALQSIWMEIKYFIDMVVPPLITIINFLVFGVIMPIISNLLAFWNAHWEQIKLILIGAWEVIKNVVILATSIIAGVITVFLNLITGNWQGAWDALIHYTNNAWGALKGIFNGIISFIKGWGGWLFDELTAPFRRAWDTIQDIVNKIKNALDFTKRHSPSVLDIVRSGVGQVNKALEGLTVSPALNPKLAFAGVTQGNTGINNITISLAGAYITDFSQATDLGERIGDSIIKKLQMNVKF
jgi:tape measure domain-containing protein